MKVSDILYELQMVKPFVIIANFRGEPSTEFVEFKNKSDIQPFEFENFVVAHNGTISNDKVILHGGHLEEKFGDKKIIDSYAILESAMHNHKPQDILNSLQGSYAFSLLHPNNSLLLARNYRDLCVVKDDEHVYWASKPENLEVLKNNEFEQFDSIPPYSHIVLDKNYMVQTVDFPTNRKRAIVVISGGLDSTTSATQACMENEEVVLLHILYGCKAESKEVEAVKNIHKYLSEKFPHTKVTLELHRESLFEKLGNATLIDGHDKIAKGDVGVETHHEWVHARNLVMIAIASAYCDRYNIGRIYLGLNMEEGSAYPDNTTEFYERLTKVLQVGTVSRPRIFNPLANLMKHEIVKHALTINAPIHLSWSCYHSGSEHCGECGPCIMRKVAFERNNLKP